MTGFRLSWCPHVENRSALPLSQHNRDLLNALARN